MRSYYSHDFADRAELSSIKEYIYCYRGIINDKYAFMDTNPGKTNNKDHLIIILLYPSLI